MMLLDLFVPADLTVSEPTEKLSVAFQCSTGWAVTGNPLPLRINDSSICHLFELLKA